MKFSVLVKSAIQSLKGNARRTILTMLGIIIGIASVITIISLGKGFQKQTIDSLTEGSEDKVSVNFYFIPSNPDDNQQINGFSDQDIFAINAIEGVYLTEIPEPENSQTDYATTITIKGQPEMERLSVVDTPGDTIVIGEPIAQVDIDAYKKVAIISEELAEKLYGTPEKAIGKGATLSGETFYIKGIKANPNNNFSFNLSVDFTIEQPIEVPKTTYHRYFKTEEPQQSLLVYIEPGYDTKKVSKDVQNFLDKEGSERKRGSYSYFDMSDMLEGIGKVLNGITYFISSIAGISLFIAGVGVMNMMYISVSERTKEIGIRRAMGATKRSIQIQFLSEGIIITSIGGIIGYLLGIGLAKLIAGFLPFDSYIDLFSIGLSMGISIFIGIVFSVFPAKAAAKKDVIDILR